MILSKFYINAEIHKYEYFDKTNRNKYQQQNIKLTHIKNSFTVHYNNTDL
jgi:hypothetical protein